jgi:hypothetical protein
MADIKSSRRQEKKRRKPPVSSEGGHTPLCVNQLDTAAALPQQGQLTQGVEPTQGMFTVDWWLYGKYCSTNHQLLRFYFDKLSSNLSELHLSPFDTLTIVNFPSRL